MPASLCVLTGFLLVSTHVLLLCLSSTHLFYFGRPRPAAKEVSSVAIVHLTARSTYRMGCPFTMIGELQPLCISRLIHLLTLVILDLNTQIISVHQLKLSPLLWQCFITTIFTIYTHATIHSTKYQSYDVTFCLQAESYCCLWGQFY